MMSPASVLTTACKISLVPSTTGDEIVNLQDKHNNHAKLVSQSVSHQADSETPREFAPAVSGNGHTPFQRTWAWLMHVNDCKLVQDGVRDACWDSPLFHACTSSHVKRLRGDFCDAAGGKIDGLDIKSAVESRRAVVDNNAREISWFAHTKRGGVGGGGWVEEDEKLAVCNFDIVVWASKYGCL